MPFPTTPVLDSFTRANESPVASGWLGPTRPAGGQLKILSNQLLMLAPADASNSNHSYFNTSYAADQEGYVTVVTLPAAAGGVSVTARIVSPGVGGVNFYQWTYTTGTGWRLFVVIGNSYTQLGSTAATPVLSAGDTIGLRLIGPTLTGLAKLSGVWTEILTINNSQITAGGFLGVEITDATAVTDDFGGGPWVNVLQGLDTTQFPKPNMRSSA